MARTCYPVKRVSGQKRIRMAAERRKHKGACHCGGVRFHFYTKISGDITAWDCNCSICNMKKNVHTVVPSKNFELIQGEDLLTTYTFNTHKAKHMFCKICGVQAFYIPRSNPDGYAITMACIDPSTLGTVVIKKFNGASEWEESFTNTSIGEYSR